MRLQTASGILGSQCCEGSECLSRFPVLLQFLSEIPGSKSCSQALSDIPWFSKSQ